ncbi:MAG TPA: DmsC/YnfH family molybdoenzyme membrane anchor subunit [Symbiobacteriaceae bacterium]|jgi:anaerobic dimethyl sulfoxide reductase subunit C (anchor subunit)|nr:DmsC/YnfH family molybdoenzyme membrane anchor subunit [Symbiobacteriaceae bacterium]
MELQELALVLFTVLAQASIGAFILIAWLRLRGRDEAMDAAYRKAVVVLVPIMVVGLLASVFHLGRPLHAMTALNRLSTSWLSREIFFSGGFFVLLVASVLLNRMPGLRKVIDALAAVAGVASVISMAMVYQMTVRTAWQGWGTHVAFAGTALVVGMGLAAGLIAFFGRENPQVAANLHWLVGGTVVVLIVGLAAYPLYLASLAGAGPAAEQTLHLLGGEYSVALALRWVLTLAGGLVPLVFAWRRLAAGKATYGLVYTALAFLVAGELVGRYLFYVTGVSIGIG